MSKMAVIYWSQTGNTKAMAEAIAQGAQSAGAAVDLKDVTEISVNEALEYDLLALGCPAMGAEVLEEIDFEPFFAELEKRLSGKSVALFGSYGWGDGQWMRDWVKRTEASGARLYDEGLMINEMPDADGLEQCRQFGAGFAG